MTEYKEIIVALIAVSGAVLAYLLQKNKELNRKFRSKTARHTINGSWSSRSQNCHFQTLVQPY
jgi:hypothetical protein